MNLGFDLSLAMQQKLSPQMIQSLKLLQTTSLQLEQQILTELAMNPLLEVDESSEIEEVIDEEPIGSTDDDGELHVADDEMDSSEYLEDGFAHSFDTGTSQTERQEKKDYRDSLRVYEQTLDEHLEKQILDLSLDDNMEMLLKYLVGCLDENGYLIVPDEEIIRAIDVSEEDLRVGIYRLQQMDPAGIGASNLQECLMLQIEREGGIQWLAYEILENYWSLFEKHKIPALARALDVDTIDIQDAIELIKELDPHPAKQLLGDSSSTIIPDLLIEEVDGKLVVVINDSFIPDLKINIAYSDMLKRKSNVKKDDKQFIRDKFNSANWLIKAVEQRRSTMLKVMQAIIDRQKRWFEEGPPNLSPLKLQDIADEIKMHVSTISRVTSNKYVQTPFGLFELKYFFNDSLGKDSDGEDLSTAKIKNKLKDMIGAENKSKPLSDQKLSDLMKTEGFALARRTVVKYREQLGIPSSRMRKSYE